MPGVFGEIGNEKVRMHFECVVDELYQIVILVDSVTVDGKTYTKGQKPFVNMLSVDPDQIWNLQAVPCMNPPYLIVHADQVLRPLPEEVLI
tara:strand:- start:76 stop:348 length:273 start_codon:yes stop_codon:yes gene_type:complete